MQKLFELEQTRLLENTDQMFRCMHDEENIAIISSLYRRVHTCLKYLLHVREIKQVFQVVF